MKNDYIHIKNASGGHIYLLKVCRLYCEEENVNMFTLIKGAKRQIVSVWKGAVYETLDGGTVGPAISHFCLFCHYQTVGANTVSLVIMLY